MFDLVTGTDEVRKAMTEQMATGEVMSERMRAEDAMKRLEDVAGTGASRVPGGGVT
jgi:hypothetical protein